MGTPLFTEEELAERKAAFSRLDAQRKELGTTFDEYWKQRQALEAAQLSEVVRRTQARVEEYLNGLIIVVGSRGESGVSFYEIFSNADTESFIALLAMHDTPEVRRDLYTILRGLSEVPRSWARSAIVRFFRGTGKQAKATYHGAGLFGTRYGWKTREIDLVCQWMVDTLYGRPLMLFAAARDELIDADPDYEIRSETNEFAVTRFDRDAAFTQKLCEMLEARGLGPVPAPASQKPKKPRKVKEFKSGDVIRRRQLRDLPLPAHVRIPIQRFDEESEQWLDATIEHVVLKLWDGGVYEYALVAPNGKAYTKAYSLSYMTQEKAWLEGATFLGPWTGDLVGKHLKLNFRHRRWS